MNPKVELIQASNNLATMQPIYTFRLTYQRSNWLLEGLGLSRYFEKWLTSSYCATSPEKDGLDLLIPALLDVNDDVYWEMRRKLADIILFANTIFKATAPAASGNPCGHITGADVKKAMELFGPHLQDVLKQYSPGEVHDPGLGTEHLYVATKYGWE